jgi:SecD/SecF fusion protein
LSNRTRNAVVLALVGVLLVLAALEIVPGTPASKPTRLGLDLKGGVELVYQARPTPQVPKVTPQALADAVNVIRKRTDSLGVSEPEIQQAGTDEISIGLPAVKNAQRAEQQVGTTAQLQFYDWEPNLIGANGKYLLPDPPNDNTVINAQPMIGLWSAVQAASKAQPKAESTDIPPGGPSKQIVQLYHGNQKQIEAYYDRKNDTSGTKYYVFAPGTGNARKVLRPGEIGVNQTAFTTGVNDATSYYTSCSDITNDYEGSAPTTGPRARGPHIPLKTQPKGTACAYTLQQLGNYGPPAGSTVVKVPQGITIVKQAAPKKGQKSSIANNAFYVLEDDSELSGSDITNPKQNFDPQTQEPVVTMDFTNKGRKAFARATKREAQRGANILLPPGTNKQAAFQNFAITLDGQIVSLANISFVDNPDGIPGDTGAQISGLGGITEAQDLANNLRIGALPVNLKLISKTQVSSTLGKQALNQGLVAGGAGIVATLIFLLLFYRFLGLVAALGLLTYAWLLFALVKLIPITLTLPGIAGLILTLGVAADANVVIFERVKEEARSGKSIPAAIAGGYGKAIKTIADANAVTLFVAFILFTLATAGVKGFAFTLGIGTLVSLFTAVLFTSAMLGTMSRRKVLRTKWAIHAGAERLRWHFDFMGNSRWFFSMSGIIILAGAIAISTLGLKFGIDFESGTRITTPVQKAASVQQVRNVLTPLGYGDSKIQSVNDPQLGKYVFQISTRKLEPNRVNTVQAALDKNFGVNRADFSSSSVGPTFGQQIARTAAIAIIASLLVISIYIGLRFEFKFAVPVLIALAHDLLITSGVYALTGREVTTSTIAALLTILGYSLYDTVIVFDRIRENVPRMPRATFSQIVNRSMSEVLTRSLVTTLSALLPISALLFFGGETLKDFGFALLVGVASGAYSSIFIAAPVLTHWKEREPVYRRRRRVVMEDHGGVVPPYAEGTLGGEDEAVPSAPKRRLPGRPGRRAAPEPAASPGDGGPVPGVLPPTPAPAAATTTAERERPEPDGDGDGAPAGGDVSRESAQESVRAKAEQRRKERQRQRKRHGRR